MLQSIWLLLNNYGLDIEEIANAMAKLFQVSGDPTNPVYSGGLKDLAEIPVIGDLLKAFASFAPILTTTTTEVIS